jgi:hypothetical protein
LRILWPTHDFQSAFAIHTKRTSVQNAFHNTSAKHAKSALGDNFSHRGGNHGLHRLLCLRTASTGSFGMLEQGGNQRVFLRTQDALISH